MLKPSKKIRLLSEYQVLNYFMTHVDLAIDLSTKPVRSVAKLTLSPNSKAPNSGGPLWLDGELITLEAVKLNGKSLDAQDYELKEEGMLIKNAPINQPFCVEVRCLLQECTDLFGLYEADGITLVKAETEGLRRVFFCIDRPDNLATYTTKISADIRTHPILLSNGCLIEKSTGSETIHSVTWADSLPKPTYLFALVAGHLNYSVTHYTSRLGHTIPIEFYVSSQDEAKCSFAKEVIKKAMAWDEQIFDLDCELTQQMIAGVDKYASGASEPTGLNLFNTENLFALPEIKTDLGILRVLEVVAHEYFHYWTGNRVTIRDWFNLTFKEGLTTFRAALFTEDLLGTSLSRLINGKTLDPRAPRESTYTAVRSLYTSAAYEKGAEICRMMMLVVGRALFCHSLGLFLKKYDRKAVTVEDLIDELTTLTKKDLTPFLRWFTEPGIPELNITDDYDERHQRYELHIKMNSDFLKPVPLVIGLLDNQGNELLSDTLLIINKEEQVIHFNELPTHPIPSLLRDYSAPVHCNYDYDNDQLLVLMRYDTNTYNRCEAAKRLTLNLVSEFCRMKTIQFPHAYFKVYESILVDYRLEPWVAAELLSISSEEELISALDKPSFALIIEARQFIQIAIAQALKASWYLLHQRIHQNDAYIKKPCTLFDMNAAGLRRLYEVYYSYQYHLDFEATKNSLVTLFNQQLDKNMTHTTAALNLLAQMGCDDELDNALQQFYTRWQDDTHAINYWLRIQAALHSPTVISRVNELLEHPAFNVLNPNKVYALLGTFMNNPYGCLDPSGKGYELIAEMILALDKINPPLAAKLLVKLSSWQRLEDQQLLIKKQLVRIQMNAQSNDVKNCALHN